LRQNKKLADADKAVASRQGEQAEAAPPPQRERMPEPMASALLFMDVPMFFFRRTPESRCLNLTVPHLWEFLWILPGS